MEVVDQGKNLLPRRPKAGAPLNPKRVRLHRGKNEDGSNPNDNDYDNDDDNGHGSLLNGFG
jgi:hypothetical protein